jgi:hypothetical protein
VSFLKAFRPPNRIVAILTPILAPIAGAISAWIAKNAPGIDIPESALNEIFIAGAAIALAPAIHWLQGRKEFDLLEAKEEALGITTSKVETPGEEEFDALGITSPAAAVPVPDTEAAGEEGDDEDVDATGFEEDEDDFDETDVIDDDGDDADAGFMDELDADLDEDEQDPLAAPSLGGR